MKTVQPPQGAKRGGGWGRHSSARRADAVPVRPVLEGGEQTSNASDFPWTPSVYNAPTDECREGWSSRVRQADPRGMARCGSGKLSLLRPSERDSAGLAFDS